MRCGTSPPSSTTPGQHWRADRPDPFTSRQQQCRPAQSTAARGGSSRGRRLWSRREAGQVQQQRLQQALRAHLPQRPIDPRWFFHRLSTRERAAHADSDGRAQHCGATTCLRRSAYSSTRKRSRAGADSAFGYARTRRAKTSAAAAQATRATSCWQPAARLAMALCHLTDMISIQVVVSKTLSVARRWSLLRWRLSDAHCSHTAPSIEHVVDQRARRATSQRREAIAAVCGVWADVSRA